MKSLIIIFVILIVGIIFIALSDFTSTSTIDQTNYNEVSWRLPVEKEIIKVQNSFLQSEIAICSSYYIKKFVGEKYLIACDTGKGSWTYYTVYPGQNKVFDTPGDLVATLNPPQKFLSQSEEELVGQTPRRTGKSKSRANTPALEAR